MKESTRIKRNMALENTHSCEITSSDGKIYEGLWENGVKHGKGKEYDPVSQSWINGEWKNDTKIN